MEYLWGLYKILYKHLGGFILQITNNVMRGEEMPEQWTEGEIVHIRKEDRKQERANYLPICITPIIYKIWHKLQTNRQERIRHVVTSSTQYGYKSGISTIDAIAKIEHAIQTGPASTTIVPMGLSKSFGCVNRLILWTTLYKLGLPIPVILHMENSYQNTTRRHKNNGVYGPPTPNNVGVFQGSALSATPFVIYLDDVMHD